MILLTFAGTVFYYLCHMFRKWTYFLMLLAMLLTASHNLVAHDHHQVLETGTDQHTDDQDDDHGSHTFFSYGHIDESFLNNSDGVQLNYEPVILDCIHVFPEASLPAPEGRTWLFVTSDSSPPEKICFSLRSLRAPPSFIG